MGTQSEGLRLHGRPLVHPVFQSIEFIVGKAGYRQGHAFHRPVVGIVIKVIRVRAGVFPGQAELDIVGEFVIGLEFVLLAEFQHFVEQGAFHSPGAIHD